MTRDAIWLDIVSERYRQKRLMSEGKFDRDMAAPSSELPPAAKLTVLAEEFGEVARHVADDIAKPVPRGPGIARDALREELIQLAACCVAWVEELDDVPQELTLAQARSAAVAAYASNPNADGLPVMAFAVEGGAS